jgi:hypothetical protein
VFERIANLQGGGDSRELADPFISIVALISKKVGALQERMGGEGQTMDACREALWPFAQVLQLWHVTLTESDPG